MDRNDNFYLKPDFVEHSEQDQKSKTYSTMFNENRTMIIIFSVVVVILIAIIMWLYWKSSHKEARIPPPRRSLPPPPSSADDEEERVDKPAKATATTTAPTPVSVPKTPAPAAEPTIVPENPSAHADIVKTVDDEELNRYINLDKKD